MSADKMNATDFMNLLFAGLNEPTDVLKCRNEAQSWIASYIKRAFKEKTYFINRNLLCQMISLSPYIPKNLLMVVVKRAIKILDNNQELFRRENNNYIFTSKNKNDYLDFIHSMDFNGATEFRF